MIPGEIAKSFPFQIRSSQPLGGGSINNVFRLLTSNGEFCLKFNYSDKYPGMFASEAEGLSLLASTKEIRVPSVISEGCVGSYSYLLLEFIRPVKPVSNFMTEFGQRLASLHSHSAGKYGLQKDNYMGSLMQQNCWHDDWVTFFVEERLQKQVSLAYQTGALSINHVSSFEQLYPRLKTLLPEEKPALLHGDLWSGNFITSETGHACIFDPAVYYGNREIDIAMTTMFGGFSREFYAGYNESWPLESGWEERIDIYNLYPLLIHLNLFGSGYLGQILSTIRRFA
jgi:protein-ribulosamine 3-kinase